MKDKKKCSLSITTKVDLERGREREIDRGRWRGGERGRERD
jgi:hypothetical protein